MSKKKTTKILVDLYEYKEQIEKKAKLKGSKTIPYIRMLVVKDLSTDK